MFGISLAEISIILIIAIILVPAKELPKIKDFAVAPIKKHNKCMFNYYVNLI